VFPLAEVRAEEIETIHTKCQNEKKQKLNQFQENYYSQQTKERLNNNFSKMSIASKECVQSVSDIYIERIDKGSQNKLYVENISHYEINMIDNNLCSSNKQEKIIIQSTNENNKNKYLEYINSNVKNFEKHINENERYQINEHSNNQVDYMKNLKNHAEKRQVHERDLQNNRAKKRCRYQQDLENNRAKKRRQYE